MKVIITFTYCCNNLSKSAVYSSGKSLENSGNFILPLCGHLDLFSSMKVVLEVPFLAVRQLCVNCTANGCRMMVR